MEFINFILKYIWLQHNFLFQIILILVIELLFFLNLSLNATFELI